MAGKLLVTDTGNGSQIQLLGARGQPLMMSQVFTEPRAKGATVRAVRGILGEDVPVEDRTKPRRTG